MSDIARGTFEVEMTPGPPEAGGELDRFDFTKKFHGDLAATGVGVMLTCGDPQSGEAGYVAMETVRGRLGDREGSFALQQIGQMHGGSQTLDYQVVPGSGHGELMHIVGTLNLDIELDGTHRYEFEYEI